MQLQHILIAYEYITQLLRIVIHIKKNEISYS